MWLENKHRVRINHAGNGLEQRIGGYRVDGLQLDSVTKTPNHIYEFYGCYYHGCEKLELGQL